MSNQHFPRKPPARFHFTSSASTDIAYYVEGFFLHHRSQRHSPWTVAFYQNSLKRFLDWLEREHGPLDLAAITANHIRSYLLYLNEQTAEHSRDKPLRPATIHAYTRTLRTFFRWAAKEAPL